MNILMYIHPITLSQTNNTKSVFASINESCLWTQITKKSMPIYKSKQLKYNSNSKKSYIVVKQLTIQSRTVCSEIHL